MVKTLLLGFIFGFLLQYGRLNRYNTISGMAILKDFAVAKAIAIALAVGALLINIEIALGWAEYHVKAFELTGLVVGGLLFGAGMAILGYCPGTLAVSLGEGSADALVGILGGFTGGVIFTLLQPKIAALTGPDLGILTLHSLTGQTPVLFFILLTVFSVLLALVAFWLDRKEKNSGKRWLYAGIGLGVLNAVMFLSGVSNRGMGASSLYPYLGDWLTRQTSNLYYMKIQGSAQWQIYFLGGALLAGLVMALVEKRFRIVLIHENWKKYKNTSPVSRIIWAFAGGFLLIFGARVAGGCTSGHVMSGGMQVGFHSLTFAAFTFAGLLLTGRVFYKK